MNSPFEKIVDQLRLQEAEFHGEVQRLKEKLTGVTKQLAQVQTAIHSLSGKLAAPTGSIARLPAKPTLSIDHIRQIVLDVKRRKPDSTDQQLFEHVEAELIAKGGKKHGLKAKFQKVLNEIVEQEAAQQAVTDT